MQRLQVAGRVLSAILLALIARAIISGPSTATGLGAGIIAVLLLATVLLTRHGRQVEPPRPRPRIALAFRAVTTRRLRFRVSRRPSAHRSGHHTGNGEGPNEIIKKAQDSLLPRLSEMPGFHGYYLIEAGDGVFSSVSIFDTEAQAEESTRVASTWVRDQKLETALTSPPKITNGNVVVRETRELVAA